MSQIRKTEAEIIEIKRQSAIKNLDKAMKKLVLKTAIKKHRLRFVVRQDLDMVVCYSNFNNHDIYKLSTALRNPIDPWNVQEGKFIAATNMLENHFIQLKFDKRKHYPIIANIHDMCDILV